jgi:hypothetical protein
VVYNQYARGVMVDGVIACCRATSECGSRHDAFSHMEEFTHLCPQASPCGLINDPDHVYRFHHAPTLTVPSYHIMAYHPNDTRMDVCDN